MKISPWATGAMKVAVLSAAFAIPGSGMAMAAGPIQSTSGNGSIGGGNQINAPINAPIDVCGNAVAILGGALAGCQGGAAVFTGGGHGPSVIQHSSGNGSILGGNQINAPINAPIDVCGNAVAVLGGALAGCRGGSVVWTTAVIKHTPSVIQSTSGNGSILGGNQANVPVNVPVDVCGNAVALLGLADAGCVGGASVHNGGGDGRSVVQHSSGNGSIAGGNQINAPVNAPVDVCGNSAAAAGLASAHCKGGASVKDGHSGAVQSTSGNGSILGGNQINAPINAPVDVCGNAVAVLGLADAGCKGGATVTSVTKPHHPGKPGKPCKPHHPGKPCKPHHPGKPGTTTTTTTTTTGGSPQTTAQTVSSTHGLLPTTGADLAAMVAAGLAAIAAGVVSLFTIRRRRAARI
jgi:LPXTG-motif cell wall-anchored protein